MSIKKQKIEYLEKYAQHSVASAKRDYINMLPIVNDCIFEEILAFFEGAIKPYFEVGTKNTKGEWVYDTTRRTLFNVVREQFIDTCLIWIDKCGKPDIYNKYLKDRLTQMHIHSEKLFENTVFAPYKYIYDSILISDIFES